MYFLVLFIQVPRTSSQKGLSQSSHRQLGYLQKDVAWIESKHGMKTMYITKWCGSSTGIRHRSNFRWMDSIKYHYSHILELLHMRMKTFQMFIEMRTFILTWILNNSWCIQFYRDELSVKMFSKTTQIASLYFPLKHHTTSF